MALLVIYVVLFSFLGLDVGCRKQMGKWFEILILNINVSKLALTNEYVRIWSIIVGVFAVTLLGLFIVGIKLFWWIKFK